ncbi:CD276 antigen-like [Pempheris klunzingeri]|uniref:CD276 antigen-like n=1 Tax=Pempheris klunzingeri TaxID=3127111 RepID=UPI0039811E46
MIVVCLLTLSVLWSLTQGDAEVSCVFMESCMLPCSFQAGDDPVVHWVDVMQDRTVHYYRSQDQLGGQEQRFRNRTLMFRDQISRGNASLLLMRVEVQDQGRYSCYTSTIRGNKDSFINLKVDALVSKVDIQQEGNWITCRSEGIYPEPELTWSTSPPSNKTLNTPTTNQTEQQLYSISSSLMLSDKVTDLVYSCTVSTRSSWKRNTFSTTKQDAEVSCVFMESCMLPCSFQGGNHPVVHWIYGMMDRTVHSYYRSKDQLADQDQHFRGRTLMFRDQISRGNASLLLKRVEVQDQGRYKCYTSTITRIGYNKSIINLKVDAPVSKVDIQQAGNWITCRSEGIYPEPELTWSTSPPSTVTLNTPTSLQRTEQQLYSISSSLMLSDKVTDLVYSCTVSTRSSWKRNTFNTTKQDAEVSCVFMESCMLPCSFQAGDDPVVHWRFGRKEDTFVHSYYGSQDQLGGQDQLFRGRTLMFRDQISRGNASLQLMRVEVLDQGRYKCYTSTLRGNKDSYINLKMDAPVGKIDIQQAGNWITCSSEGIYPKPELTWSTSPPSNKTLNTTTSLQRTEQQLYSISSSLMLSDKVTDLVYSCTVSTRSSWKRNTFNTTKQEPPVDEETPGSKGAVIGGVVAGLFGLFVVIVAVAAFRASIGHKGKFSALEIFLN